MSNEAIELKVAQMMGVISRRVKKEIDEKNKRKFAKEVKRRIELEKK